MKKKNVRFGVAQFTSVNFCACTVKGGFTLCIFCKS